MPLTLGRPKDRTQDAPSKQEAAKPVVAGASTATSRNAHNILLIIRREFNTRVRKRGFVISTIILVILVVAAAFVPTIIGALTSSGSHYTLRVVNNAGSIGGQDAPALLNTALNTTYDSSGKPKPTAANATPEFDIKTIQASELDNLRQQVKDGKLDILLVINRDPSGELRFEYYSNSDSASNSVTASRVQAVTAQMGFLDKLSRLGISQAQLVSLFQQPAFETRNAQQEKTGRSATESAAGYAIAFAGIILIFTSILNYGQAVATGAIEEKSSRVMEIMINAATPFQLMLGKIIGIGLSGFLQIGLLSAAGVVAFLAQGPFKRAFLPGLDNGNSFDISGLSVGLLLLLFVYFVLGFLLYATFYAAIGSLLSRQEDLQTAVTPLTFLFMAGYFAAIFALSVPDALWVTVLSYIPLFTPMVMLTRAALTTLAWWEVPVSIAIMVISILVFTWLASRIYRVGVLLYGQKPSFRQALKMARSK